MKLNFLVNPKKILKLMKTMKIMKKMKIIKVQKMLTQNLFNNNKFSIKVIKII